MKVPEAAGVAITGLPTIGVRFVPVHCRFVPVADRVSEVPRQTVAEGKTVMTGGAGGVGSVRVTDCGADTQPLRETVTE
ncbi:hypothetical protein GCM10027347_60120 [Larkinella harenae]